MKQLDLLIRLYNNQLFFRIDEMTAEVIHIYIGTYYIFYISVYASGILE